MLGRGLGRLLWRFLRLGSCVGELLIDVRDEGGFDCDWGGWDVRVVWIFGFQRTGDHVFDCLVGFCN